MGRGGHSDDEGSPYDQSLEEVEFMRSACAAAQRGKTAELERMLLRRPFLVDCDGVNNQSGYTPLHYASREGHIDVALLLLRHEANVNSKTKAGKATPLHRAAFTGQAELIRLLLANGADAAVQDADGETALHKAAAQGHAEVTRLLLQACPEATRIADRRNKTPREYAFGDVCQVFDS